MTNIIPEKSRQFAVSVVEQLRQAGYQSYWAGGCVRDQLLGVTPRDYDVATNAVPEQIQKVFERKKTLSIGASFGVITVLGPPSAGQIDVATFRQDAEYSDGRHPDQVIFTSAQEDASRRDFTINGMFFDPLDDQLIDYVDGQSDLQQQLVRAIGDPQQRFAEDKLRILRAVRFAATLGFQIETGTRSAIERYANDLTIVSAERITAELQRMLTDANRRQAVQRLEETGLLAVILPDGEYDADDFSSRLQVALEALTILKTADFATTLALLWSQLVSAADSSLAEAMAQRLKLSNLETKSIVWMLSQEAQIIQADKIDWPVLQPILVDSRIENLLDLAEARLKAQQQTTDGIETCRQKLLLPAEKLNPPPLLTGNDLQQLGLPSSPLFREILEQIRDAQLLGQLDNKATALQWVQDRWPA